VRWAPAGAAIFAVLLFTWRDVLALRPTVLIPLAIALVIAWWLSPLNGRWGTRHRDVVAHPESHPVVIYWRPGCVYCLRLRGVLGSDRRRATWISIWSDEEAAAFVRSINDGNETVPTVRIGEQVHTNPEPDLVRAALR
jgi:mycoredoxin